MYAFCAAQKSIGRCQDGKRLILTPAKIRFIHCVIIMCMTLDLSLNYFFNIK